MQYPRVESQLEASLESMNYCTLSKKHKCDDRAYGNECKLHDRDTRASMECPFEVRIIELPSNKDFSVDATVKVVEGQCNCHEHRSASAGTQGTVVSIDRGGNVRADRIVISVGDAEYIHCEHCLEVVHA